MMSKVLRPLRAGSGLLAATVLLSIVPSASAETAFMAVCEGRNDAQVWIQFNLNAHSYSTLDALLETVGTEDCAVAQQRLEAVTDLRLPEPAETAMPLTCLLVDLPTVVDVQMIAIATPNLIRLDLSGKVVADLSPIVHLNQLEALYLANTNITDIAPLVGLPLTTLDISYNQIASIEPIAELSELRALDISYNPITDISPLDAIYTPYNANEWDYLILSGLDYRLDNCPVALADACEGDIYSNID